MPARHKTAAGQTIAVDPIKAEGDRPGFFARLSAYRKTVVALLAGALGWAATTVVPDGHVDRAEWYALAVVLAGVFGVYVAPNTRPDELDAEAGYSPLDLLVWVLIAVILVLVIVFLAHQV